MRKKIIANRKNDLVTFNNLPLYLFLIIRNSYVSLTQTTESTTVRKLNKTNTKKNTKQNNSI